MSDDFDVFRPHGGSSVYLPDGLARPEYDPWTHIRRDLIDAMGALYPRYLAVKWLLAGTHGRRAPARGIAQRAARHRRNARGFVPGAHPAARPMHEAYRARARKRRRGGRR